MCTAIWHDGCFGRTLDLDRRYGEKVTVTPHPIPRRIVCTPELEINNRFCYNTISKI